MAGKDLRHSVTVFVEQLRDKVQRLTAEVTTLDVRTYVAPVEQLAAAAAELDAGAAMTTAAQRRGYTRITYDCDLTSCVETDRADDVDPAVEAIHRSAVDGAVAGRDVVLGMAREVIERVR